MVEVVRPVMGWGLSELGDAVGGTAGIMDGPVGELALVGPGQGVCRDPDCELG